MTAGRERPRGGGRPPWAAWAAGWVHGSRAGLLLIAALVGVGSGLGSVVFRYLKGGAGR